MSEKIKSHLVPNWRDCWRWFSMVAMAIASVIQLVWLELPPDMKATLHPQLVQWLSLAVLVLGIVGRLVRQEPRQ